MNSHLPIRITSYEDLHREKERLSESLKMQRARITKDIDSIKEEFRPVVVASEMMAKLFHREDGKDGLVATGANLTIDLLTQSLFSKSSFLVRLLLPNILKNLSSHYLPKATPARRREPVPAGH